MSRNFELLRKLGRERDLLPAQDAPAQDHVESEIPPRRTAPRQTEPQALGSSPRHDEKTENRRRWPTRWSELVRRHTAAQRATRQVERKALSQAEHLKLVQRVFLLPESKAPRLVLFAGVDEDLECAAICVQAARTLANLKQGSVCLVDADFSFPSLHRHLGAENAPGLTEAMRKNLPIREFAQPVARGNLWLISFGHSSYTESGFLASPSLGHRLRELREQFEHTLICAPPLGLFPDAVLLSGLTDGVVLVIEASATQRQAAKRVKETLDIAGTKVLGVVLNNQESPIPDFISRRL